MTIDANYVSPTVRLAFAREDHPDLTVTYDIIPVEESDIHEAFRDGPWGEIRWVIVATIEIPGREPIIGWKEATPKTSVKGKWVDVEFGPEYQAKLQTMALGRALKQLGYPDKLPEFKALISWRKSQIEIAQRLAGVAPALAAANADKAIAAIATRSEEFNEIGVTAAEAGADDDDIADGEIVDEPAPRNTVAPADASNGAASEYASMLAMLPEDLQARIAALPAGDRDTLVKTLYGRLGSKDTLGTADVRLVTSMVTGLEPKKAAS